MPLSFNHLITQVVEVEGGVGYSLVGDDADVYGLEVDGQLGEGGVDDILGRGFAHEVCVCCLIFSLFPGQWSNSALSFALGSKCFE